MHTSVRRSRSLLPLKALGLALVASLVAALPAAAVSYTPPELVFPSGGSPIQSMVRDAAGASHIATESSAGGIWYVTNASGNFEKCPVSAGNDHEPSIAVSGGTVHVAFARLGDGRGIYTASGTGDCNWDVKVRFAGQARRPALAARGSTLSLAFKSDNRLKFRKGQAGADNWSTKETVDNDCCTSPPALALTHTGAPRLAYGDGTKRQNGLKYAMRTSKGWQKTKVARGRVKHVALTLDQFAWPGKEPLNSPRIAYAVKKQGTYLADKRYSGTSGSWKKDFLGRSYGPVDVFHHSNLTYVLHTRSGKIRYDRWSGGIRFSGLLIGNGSDTYPQIDSGVFSFTRGSKGVFHSNLQ